MSGDGGMPLQCVGVGGGVGNYRPILPTGFFDVDSGNDEPGGLCWRHKV